MQIEHGYMVTLDGQPHERGLTKAHAEARAKYLQEGFDHYRANDKRRTGCFEVKPDREHQEDLDTLYGLWKESV